MRFRLVFAGVTAVAAGAGVYAIFGGKGPPPPRSVSATNSRPRTVSCPARRQIVNIHNTGLRDQRQVLKEALRTDGTTVRLDPDVDLDFSNFPIDSLPLTFGRCVTLTSVSAFDDPVLSPGASATARSSVAASIVPTITEARSPGVPGPVLRYGKARAEASVLLAIRCEAGESVNDGARISGFRLFGPSFGLQSTNEVGIQIFRCIDVDVSNMEIAGWGGTGVSVEDDAGEDTSVDNGEGGRISEFGQITIRDNWIHHNQHPQKDGHAQGYGVGVNHGAWAHIFQNAFDHNRHSIEAAGDAGGYRAERNLVLKGGGIHGKWYNQYTHAFDVHGTGCRWSSNLCGEAGIRFVYIGNAFQYRKDYAIKIRGKPKRRVVIAENVFPHPGLENDWGDDAIHLNTTENVRIGPGNVIKFDSFGKLGVCDFDGDGVDDLFLATGQSWWFSSFGEFHWSFLSAKTERMTDVALGYFDNDLRCDVVAQEGDHWAYSSGGTSEWRLLGNFGAPLNTVVFGRFDPNDRDERPGATRRTTHAFRRARTGQWVVTPLTTRDWQPVASSRFPMNELRFGDFTGDGVTDVLAVESGRWAISRSARGTWRRLNRTLGDEVANLYIANMDADDNIDDILRLDIETRGRSNTPARITRARWWRSKNGREPWQLWKSYEFKFSNTPEFVTPRDGFVGRFGAAPGGGTLIIGPTRFGHFHSKAAGTTRALRDWKSVFAY